MAYQTIITRHASSVLIAMLAIYGDLQAQPNHNNTSKEKIPAVTFFPWNAKGVEPEFWASAGKDLETAWQNLISQEFGEKLTPIIDNAKNSAEQIIARSFLTKTHAVKEPLNTDAPPLTIEPVACMVAGHLALFVTGTHAEKGTLLALSQRVLTTAEAQSAYKNKTWAPLAARHLTSLWQEAQNTLKQTAAAKNALTTRLFAMEETRAFDEMQRPCLSLLATTDLYQRMQVINPVGGEERALVARLFDAPPPKRSTRALALRWVFPTRSPQRAALPYQLKLAVTGAETVLGSSLNQAKEYSVELKTAQQQLSLSLPQELQDLLAQEQKSLEPMPPQVLKTWGAWVYLDKGRAHGLKMNDRLVAKENPDTVQGHVVGYFGSELSLKNAAGAPVHEGAIVFIRKGQREAKVGQSFIYDSKKFPTPWPPK